MHEQTRVPRYVSQHRATFALRQQLQKLWVLDAGLFPAVQHSGAMSPLVFLASAVVVVVDVPKTSEDEEDGELQNRRARKKERLNTEKKAE